MIDIILGSILILIILAFLILTLLLIIAGIFNLVGVCIKTYRTEIRDRL